MTRGAFDPSLNAVLRGRLAIPQGRVSEAGGTDPLQEAAARLEACTLSIRHFEAQLSASESGHSTEDRIAVALSQALIERLRTTRGMYRRQVAEQAAAEGDPSRAGQMRGARVKGHRHYAADLVGSRRSSGTVVAHDHLPRRLGASEGTS